MSISRSAHRLRRKPHVLENRIMSMGFELLAARLHGFVLNRPHSVEGKRHVKQLCDGLRRDIDGVVYAGDNQHIAEEHDSFIAQYLATLHSEGETPHNRCIISATIHQSLHNRCNDSGKGAAMRREADDLGIQIRSQQGLPEDGERVRQLQRRPHSVRRRRRRRRGGAR